MTTISKRNGSSRNGERIVVRKSGIHGRGVFAIMPIRKGTRIIEYTGKHRPWKEAEDDPPTDPADPHHTFLFSLDNGDVIDAGIGGNEARWINHSCEPNCETMETKDDRIFIYALRTLYPGEELFYDYRIVPAERRTRKVEQNYACRCGTAKCRGTMLEPKKKRRKPRRQKGAK
ncbi:MAG TPA: SET domain-containing protein-lysine N-methyltransferase [Chthoniobacterales bacterium]|jgi:SET domain-containing protein|nr:SET domain-containing protein-lysine N-methyltransferase [Chthoniobacterales bacterium]